jgi:Rrf2 family transcriptional regulator, nitric oxide-sensitive transcriptional repressor
MQLNKFSDYALRVLMYVSTPRDLPYTIAEIAENLKVSENHLVKVVHFMAKKEWIITTRGKGGGIRLNPESLKLNVGQVLRVLEGNSQIVECHNPPCVLRSRCGLKGILDQAVEAFFMSLDQYTLEQVLSLPPTFKGDVNSPIPLINL